MLKKLFILFFCPALHRCAGTYLSLPSQSWLYPTLRVGGNNIKIFFYNFLKNFIILNIAFVIIYYILSFEFIDLTNIYNNVIPNGQSTDIPVDPVRYLPCSATGVPQSWSIVGTGLATFAALSKIPTCSPRLRVLGALGSMGVSLTTILYQTAIENPVGFNRFAYPYGLGLDSMCKGKGWPSLEAIKKSENELAQFANENIVKADKAKVDEAVNQVQDLIDKGVQLISDTAS